MRKGLELIWRRLELLLLLRHAGWPLVLTVGFISLTAQLVPAATAAATGLLVLVAAEVAQAAPFWETVSGPLAIFGGLVVYDLVSRDLVWPLRGLLTLRVNGAIRRRVRLALGGKPGISHLEDQVTRDLATLPVDDGERTIGAGAQGLLWTMIRMIGSLAAVALVALWSWPAALFEFGLLLWTRRIVRSMYARNLVEGLARIGPEIRAAQYWGGVVGSLKGAKEVRVFGFGGYGVESYRSNSIAIVRLVEEILRPAIAKGWLFGLLPAVAALIPIGFATASAVTESIGLGEFAIVLGAIVAMQGIAAPGFEAFDVEAGLANLQLLNRLEDLTRQAPSLAAGTVQDDGTVPTIRFESVSFRYPGTDRWILNGLDLEIQPGEALAIVGENGVGKTTLVKLLCGFYDPTSGRITADGIDIASIPPEQWRRKLAVIFQSFAQFHLSALDNVGLAHLSAPEKSKFARDAADAGGALELIESLPSGWDTILSREYEGGADLSGGQWQRIALARALYATHVGGRILVLDEPTANLDVHAEVELFDQLITHASGLTSIVISHRYSTVRRARRIVVIEGGGISEDGDHESLMARNGTYARLYRLQAQAFEVGQEQGASSE